MENLVYKSYHQNFNKVNINNNKISQYVPYDDYYPMDYSQNNNQNFNPYPNQINLFDAQNQNHIIFNSPKKMETDSDLIQSLTGNYLGSNHEETFSDDKSDKKEVEINLGEIIVENNYLNLFPTIKLNNSLKYKLSISENI